MTKSTVFTLSTLSTFVASALLVSVSALAEDANMGTNTNQNMGANTTAPQPAAPEHQSELGGTAKGAAIGGLGGAAVGHPVAGAAVGGVIGHHKRHKANKQAKKDAKEAQEAQKDAAGG